MTVNCSSVSVVSVGVIDVDSTGRELPTHALAPVKPANFQLAQLLSVVRSRRCCMHQLMITTAHTMRTKASDLYHQRLNDRCYLLASFSMTPRVQSVWLYLYLSDDGLIKPSF